MGHGAPPLTPPADEPTFPPVTQIGMLSLALIVAGGIYLSAHLPARVPLAPAIILLGISALLLGANLISLTRVSFFNWSRFSQVFRWALLAYTFTAGMIEYAFLEDGLRGGPLVVLTLSLVVYAAHVPVLMAFTVARYADPAPGNAPAV